MSCWWWWFCWLWWFCWWREEKRGGVSFFFWFLSFCRFREWGKTKKFSFSLFLSLSFSLSLLSLRFFFHAPITSPSPPVFDQGAISAATNTMFICLPLATAGGTAGAGGGEGAGVGGGAAGAAARGCCGGGEGVRGGGAGAGAAFLVAGGAGAARAAGGGGGGGALAWPPPPPLFGREEATGTGSFPPMRSHESLPPAASWRASMSSRWRLLRCSIWGWGEVGFFLSKKGRGKKGGRDK